MEKYFRHSDLAGTDEEQFAAFFDVPVPMSEDFIENLEWALMYLNMNKAGTPFGYDEARKDFFSISTFDGAYLMNIPKLGSEDDLMFFNPIFEKFKLSMFDEWNIKTMRFVQNEEKKLPIQLQKVRILPENERAKLMEMRGYKIAEHSFATLSKNEKWFTTRNGYALYPVDKQLENGVKYHPYFPIPVSLHKDFYIPKRAVVDFINGDEMPDILDTINMALGVRMTSYYEWFVYLRETPQSIGFKIPIAPEASKEVFALRDIPEGSARKRAICNFVRQHYRTIKTEYDPGAREVLVKKHLRGETKFSWRGLDVHIVPAEYDILKVNSKKKFLKI